MLNLNDVIRASFGSRGYWTFIIRPGYGHFMMRGKPRPRNGSWRCDRRAPEWRRRIG